MYELAGTLAVDQLVTGEVGSVGEENIVFATLLDLKAQRALARTSVTIGHGGDVVAAMKQLSIALTQPAVAWIGALLFASGFGELVSGGGADMQPLRKNGVKTR